MKKKELELFLIRNYDDGSIIDIYLTDNASKCEKIMSDIDAMDYEDRAILGSYNDILEERCKKEHIYLKSMNVGAEYNY